MIRLNRSIQNYMPRMLSREYPSLAEAFQIFKFFEPAKQRSLSAAIGTLCVGAEKLRKSKNGATSREGAWQQLRQNVTGAYIEEHS